jgi:hypothetical protein
VRRHLFGVAGPPGRHDGNVVECIRLAATLAAPV